MHVFRYSLFLAVAVVIGACSSASPTTTTTSSTTTTQPSSTTTTTEAETTTTVAAPDRVGTSTFVIPFAATLPEGSNIRRGVAIRDEYIDFSSGSNEWLVWTTAGPASIEGWAQLLVDEGAAVGGEALPATVGGAAGSLIDAQTPDN